MDLVFISIILLLCLSITRFAYRIILMLKKFVLLVCVAALLLSSSWPLSNRQLLAAEPTQTDIFISGKGDYHTYRIPSFLIAKDGSLLAFCEGRKNGRGDAGKVGLPRTKMGPVPQAGRQRQIEPEAVRCFFGTARAPYSDSAGSDRDAQDENEDIGGDPVSQCR